MKKMLMVLFILFFLSVGFVSGALVFAIIISKNPPITNQKLDQDILFALVQEWRVENGLRPYTKSQKLCDFASKRAKQIRTNFNHDEFLKDIHTTGVLGVGEYSENLAEVYEDEKTTLKGWLNSASHSAALHRDYKYSCIATYNNEAVQEFGNF
jgi:uncharacterized protein YkwD